MRRYTLDTRPWNPFHTDRYEITCNVELSAGGAESYSGGVLLGLYDGEVRRITREEGEATLHSSKLLHAVTKMRVGKGTASSCFSTACAADVIHIV